ncbi:MAG: hypothetical protein DRJ08_05150 [Acidobacteria bacterium]|nr:MAG: hypothetical protein DRJ08_05150 [Acidobacteriota bacterium]
MSRFGLFGKLGKKDCNKLKLKGDKQFSKGEFYLALVAYEDALAVSDCPAEVTVPIRENIKVCKAKLTSHNLELAISHYDAGDYDTAADFATTCLDYAEKSEMKDAARKILDDIDKQFDQFETVFGPDKAEQELLPDDDDSYAEIIIANYPPFIQQEVQENEALKYAMTALNREDLDSGKVILDMEDSPAVLYFQALYHSLNEDAATALKIFRQLSLKHPDLLDEQRWAELIGLIARAESDESVDEILENHPYPAVIRAVITLYMGREEMEAAGELLDESMELMSPSRPDPLLIGLAGIYHFRLGQFDKATKYLDNFKNIMAMRGQFTLSPEYAIPLAISLEKTGQNDEALEMALHTAKIFGLPEAIELSRNLASRSSREDLKKLAEKL